MRKKSELEIWLDRYYEKFKKNYPLEETSLKSGKDLISDIKKCIEAGKEAKEPKYEKGLVY